MGSKCSLTSITRDPSDHLWSIICWALAKFRGKQSVPDQNYCSEFLYFTQPFLHNWSNQSDPICSNPDHSCSKKHSKSGASSLHPAAQNSKHPRVAWKLLKTLISKSCPRVAAKHPKWFQIADIITLCQSHENCVHITLFKSPCTSLNQVSSIIQPWWLEGRAVVW